MTSFLKIIKQDGVVSYIPNNATNKNIQQTIQARYQGTSSYFEIEEVEMEFEEVQKESGFDKTAVAKFNPEIASRDAEIARLKAELASKEVAITDIDSDLTTALEPSNDEVEQVIKTKRGK